MSTGRSYAYSRDVKAGCETCDKQWSGGNAQGVAARHTDATGHETWVEVFMHITYGRKIKEKLDGS